MISALLTEVSKGFGEVSALQALGNFQLLAFISKKFISKIINMIAAQC